MWSLIIKGVTKFIPVKAWIALAVIVAAYFSITYYGHTKYEAGVTDTKASYDKASQKALDEDLRKVNQELKDALAQAEKDALRAAQTATEIQSYAEQNKTLQESIKKLKSQDIACRDINSSYHKLFDGIFQETTSKK
jgi:hypothetical protein